MGTGDVINRVLKDQNGEKQNINNVLFKAFREGQKRALTKVMNKLAMEEEIILDKQVKEN